MSSNRPTEQELAPMYRENSFRSGYPSGLTAGAFEMLLHYFYTRVDAHEAWDSKSAPYRSCKELVDAGLMKTSDAPHHGNWQLTTRGEVMARHIMETPLPVPDWRMP